MQVRLPAPRSPADSRGFEVRCVRSEDLTPSYPPTGGCEISVGRYQSAETWHPSEATHDFQSPGDSAAGRAMKNADARRDLGNASDRGPCRHRLHHQAIRGRVAKTSKIPREQNDLHAQEHAGPKDHDLSVHVGDVVRRKYRDAWERHQVDRLVIPESRT